MIKKIVLTENDFHKIVENSVKLMLQEELILEDSRINPVKRIIRQALGNTYNLDAVVDSEDKYVNHDPNTTWLKYFIFKLRHALSMMSNSDYPYLALAARLAFSNEVRLDSKAETSEEVVMLSKIMNLIKNDNALFQEVNNNPNITYTQLVERFKQQFEDEKAADSEAANKVEVTDNGYEILEVPDYDTAEYYGQFSCSQSQLCYTYSEETWDSYTNNGFNKAYICLRRGWEDVPEVPTEGNPYDAYGLSMIFAFISPKGELVRSNCRWNHHIQGRYITSDVDKAFTETSLAQTVGAPFKSVFKPYDIDMDSLLIRAIENGNDDFLSKNVGEEFVIPEGVTKIGRKAFTSCSKLKSIVIPDSVTSIADDAFADCCKLTSVTIPDSVTEIGDEAFQGCENLLNLVIGSGATDIGCNAFENCFNLKNVTICSSLNEIGDGMFSECASLERIELPNSISHIGCYAFNECKSLKSINIPDGVVEIGYCAFFGCRNLNSIIIPDSVKNIDLNVFSSCTKLKNIRLSNNIHAINAGTFDECYSLTNIKIPEGVTDIGPTAFNGCSSLTSVTLPDSLVSIGREAFTYCEHLTGITIPSNVTKIYGGAFKDCNFIKDNFINNSSLNAAKNKYWEANIYDYIIDGFCIDKLKFANQYSYKICNYLGTNEEVVIPDYIEYIEESSFASNKHLKKVTIPNGVRMIGRNAFGSCENLTSVTIPSSVMTINEYAFYHCYGLKTVTILGNVNYIGKSAFSKFYITDDKLTIYIQNEKVESLLRNSGYKGKIEYIK